MGMAPPDPQPVQQDRRQQCGAILVTLALLDTQEHALAVNSTDLQRGHLADTQSGTIGHRQRGAMLEGLGRLDEARYLLATYNDRQGAPHPNGVHLGHNLLPSAGSLEEEPQTHDRRVHRDRSDPLLHAWRVAAAQLL